MFYQSKKGGFTLIELLVVISIISLLSSIVLASLSSARMKARDTRRIQDLKQIQIALEMYRNDHGRYPSGTDIPCEVNNHWCQSTELTWAPLASVLQPYINELPKDPINNVAFPWDLGHNYYSYAYSSGYFNCADGDCYDLVARLEDPNSPYKCGIKKYTYYTDGRVWCNIGYSSQLYSPQN